MRSSALLQQEEEWKDRWDLDENEDVLRGLVYPKQRRRRGAGGPTGPQGTIILTPSTIGIPDNTTPGTVIGTVAVSGGSGTYTFSLNDPSGQFQIVGNQIETIGTVIAGFFPVTINATNGAGDTPNLTTTISVVHVAVHPTYFIYGF